MILYEHFEKTMASNLLVEAKSALSTEVKQATLSEEVARRLRNTSLRLDPARRLEIIERACVKMKTSGHSEETIQQAVEQALGLLMPRSRGAGWTSIILGSNHSFRSQAGRRIQDQERKQ